MSFLSRSIVPLFLFGLPAIAASPVSGIRNFHQVDDHVYRGGQPTDEGLQYLAKIGVKTVLDLRESGERATREERLVTDLGMRYVNVPMGGLTPPTTAEITKILALLEDDNGSVFVHCLRGADRTGAVIGAYRVDHAGWDNDRAFKEALADGIGFFELPRRNYIRNFQPLTVEAKRVTQAPEPTVATATAPVQPAAASAMAIPVPSVR